MAKKVTKKVDVKKIIKGEISEVIRKLFEEQGLIVKNGQDFGMTEGTLILATDKCDVQIKLITPKAGFDRYEALEEE